MKEQFSDFGHQETEQRSLRERPQVTTDISGQAATQRRKIQRELCGLPALRKWRWESHEAKEAGVYNTGGRFTEEQGTWALKILRPSHPVFA